MRDCVFADELFCQTDSEFNFDYDTAIKACRQASYFEHALYLAKKHNQHESFLKILLEDLKNFNDALDYIATLDFFEVSVMKLQKLTLCGRPKKT